MYNRTINFLQHHHILYNIVKYGVLILLPGEWCHPKKLWQISCYWAFCTTLRWRHNERDSVSNHQPHDRLLNRLFRRRSKYTSKLRVTGLCVGNSPGTGEFPAQMASYAENVSIWWRHHDRRCLLVLGWIIISSHTSWCNNNVILLGLKS